MPAMERRSDTPVPNPIAQHVSRFDEQALLYDARAGLSPETGAAVARAIVELAAGGPNDLIVEVGAGTGAIGAHLAALSSRYLGLDLSRPMLAVFRERAGGPAPPPLIQADCDRPWPLADGVASVLFASRVIHLLNADHALQEALRVCRPAATLTIGRVQRDRDSLKSRLRHRRHALLEQAGVTPSSGDEGARRFVERCLAAGGRALGRHVAAEWTGTITPAEVIAAWEPLSRMGALALDAPVRTAILDRLRAWAHEECGGLDHPQPFRERYMIEAVRLPYEQRATSNGQRAG